jgi:hypothetical protein
MIEATTFTVWMHRGPANVFGAALRPVNRDGVTLTFADERAARDECARLGAGSGDPHTRYSVESKPAFGLNVAAREP